MEVSNKSPEDQSSEELKLWIDCLKLDVSNQEEALKTIASLCHTSDAASGYLVHSDALQYILKIIFKPISPLSLKVACLHVLCSACENNALVQNVLCEQNIFQMLKKFLTMKSHTKLQTLSAYLLICLVSNNERGQVLVRTSKVLETLRYIFKDVCSPTCSPSNPKRMLECLAADSEGKTELINFWQTATNALSVCVNNPQNKENQFYCSSVFPAAVAYLRNSQSSLIQTTTLSFVTNCLANNNRAQVSFRLVGGLRVLCDVMREELSSGNQVLSPVMSTLVMTLGAAVCRNQSCRNSTSELEFIPLLLQCLQLCFGTPEFKVVCLTTIASCIEECASNCEAFLLNEGIAIVIKLLDENQNCEELQKTATCLLHTYMEQTKSTDFKFEILASKGLHVSQGSQNDCHKSAAQIEKPNKSVAQIEKPNNCSTSSTLVEANGERTNVTKATQNDNTCTCDEQSAGSMVNNEIKDLTDEVCSLKQLATNNANNNSSFIASDVDERVVDVINTVWNSDLKPASATEDEITETAGSSKIFFEKVSDDDDDYGDILDGTNLAKAQYGETSNRQATVSNDIRPNKRSREALTSLGDNELGDISNIVEDTTSESSGAETSVKDTNKCFEAFFRRRKKPSNVNNARSLHHNKKSKAKTSRKCLGCKLDFDKVNSRNLLSNLRTSIHTCPVHRDYLVRVQSTINSYKRSLETKTRSPNFEFVASPRMNSQCDKSPVQILKKIKLRPKITNVAKIPFSRRDIETLRDGVREHGESWTMISEICPFVVERSPRTLKQKFKSIKKGIYRRRKRCPFSCQEINNLKKGVLKFGYSWQQIFTTFMFEEGRTPQDLKDKWRNLIK